ncbi:MAG TPA: LLM class flavin-dependent oxidoreductase [Alphaproteobacteria bacterium]|nr:LLM class flavin-dependent oxidoreductase [Alphaproteobacteria bacterium]
MELGLFMMPLHHPDRDYHTTLHEDREAILWADKLGYDHVWVGEHTTAKPEQITSPLIFMATLIEETRRIKFAPGVINLPHHHPADVAGWCAMFDHLAKGRFIMGIGTGGLVTDFELYGTLEIKNRLDMLLESIDMVHRMWREEPPYDMRGKFWNVVVKDTVWPELGLGPMVKPYQKPHPPIAISGMSPTSTSIRIAGERGWRAISANFIPSVHLKTHAALYRQGCANAGRAFDPYGWIVARSILVAESDAEAEDYVFRPKGVLAHYFGYLRDQLVRGGLAAMFKTDPAMADSALTDDYCLGAMTIYGNPATVTEKLIALREEIGDFGALLVTAHDWDDKALWKRSMALIANEVAPRLRSSGRGRAVAAASRAAR